MKHQIPEAHSLLHHVCDEGHLHVELLSRTGAVVARFMLACDDAELFALGIIHEVGHFRTASGDTIGTVEGHA